MIGLSKEAQDLIAATGSADAPHLSDKARVRAALNKRLALLPPIVPAHPPVDSSAVSTMGSAVVGTTLGKVILSSVVAVTLGSAAGLGVAQKIKRGHVASRSSSAQTAARRVAVVAPAPVPLPSGPATTSEVVQEDASPRAKTPPVRRSAPRVAIVSTRPPAANAPMVSPPPIAALLAETPEIQSVEVAPEEPLPPPPIHVTRPPEPWSQDKQVQTLREVTALINEQPQRALDLLKQWEAECPQTDWAQERAVEKILALCALHRTEEASAGARHFRQTWPSSPLVPRIAASCTGATKP